MSGSSSEERKLDPAVVMVKHNRTETPDGRPICEFCHNEQMDGARSPDWPCESYRLAMAWEQEYREHTALLEQYNALGTAYGDLERMFLAVSDAHAALVDKIAGLAAEAVR